MIIIEYLSVTFTERFYEENGTDSINKPEPQHRAEVWNVLRCLGWYWFPPSSSLINYSSGALCKYYQAARQLCPIKMCYGCWFPTARGHCAKSTASN